MAGMVKRIAKWVLILACLYISLVLILPPLVEHIFGIGVYRKGHGYINNGWVSECSYRPVLL